MTITSAQFREMLSKGDARVKSTSVARPKRRVSKASPAPEKPARAAIPLEQGLFLVVAGTPVAKPRQTQRDKWQKRPCVVRYREWADRAREVLKTRVGSSRLKTARVLHVSAYFPMPKSWPPAKRAEMRGTPHRQKPDGDNTLKAVADALVVKDETIYRKEVYKEWAIEGQERVEIYLK